jgi:hypothetical protein
MSGAYYYSQTDSADLCREGFVLLNAAHRKQKLQNIISIDLGGDAPLAQEYSNKQKPVLKIGNDAWEGQAAIKHLAGLVGEGDLPPIPRVVGEGDLPPIPPQAVKTPTPPVTPHSSETPTIASYSIVPVKPMYVLYTDENMDSIVIPADGYVMVQSYRLIRTTLGAKLPNWLRNDRPRPVLATLGEDRPTVWYGQAARDQCKMLCLLHGGAMLQ